MNYKIFSILFFIFGLVVFASGNQLIIEVTTDKYPNETSWKLFDTNYNLVQQNGTLLKNTIHRDTIDLDESTCYFWTIYDTYGDGMSNSSAPGDYKLFFNGQQIAQCGNPNFGDSISVYGIGTSCALYDVSLNELTFEAIQAFNPFEITFEVFNFGSEVIQSLELWYELGGWESETILLENLAIEFGTSTQIALPEKLQIMQAGNVNFMLSIAKVNGFADENTSNNYLIKNIEIKEGYWKKPMHEVFTSSTCPPCAAHNPVMDETLSKYPNKYSLVKYQVNWPGSGDPYYTTEVGYMVNNYGVNAAPSLFVDKFRFPLETDYYYPDNLITHLGELTTFYLQLTAELIGDSIFAAIDISSLTSMTAEGFLRLAVIENVTTGNASTNGEKEFSHVFMKFLSQKEGTSIGQFAAGKSVTLEFATSLINTNIEELTDLKLVAYVFYKNAYEILQSETIDIPFFNAPPYFTSNIASGSIAVDTFPSIQITSDKILYRADGATITEIKNHVSFINLNDPGSLVDFSAQLSENNKTISITPNVVLLPNTKFAVRITDLASKEGIVADTFEVVFTTIEALKVKEKTGSIVTLFPNPFSEKFHMNAEQDGIITVSDISGKNLAQFSLIAGLNTIDLSELSNGIYLIKSKTPKGNQVIKILKQ